MKTYSIYVDCSVCGEEFEVELERCSNKIITDCWYNTIDLNYFKGWVYEWVGRNTAWEDSELRPVFKNTFWKILGYTKIQRDIIYYIWKIFHHKARMEIWECHDCMRNEDVESE